MAIIDNTLLFSDSQAITGDEASDNVIDLHATGTPIGSDTALTRDIGKGCPIEIDVRVMEAFNTLTDLTVSVQVDTVENFASPKEVASRTYALAELTLGQQLQFPAVIPEGADQRYLRLYYNVGGSNPSTGKLFAAIVSARQTNV